MVRAGSAERRFDELPGFQPILSVATKISEVVSLMKAYTGSTTSNGFNNAFFDALDSYERHPIETIKEVKCQMGNRVFSHTLSMLLSAASTGLHRSIKHSIKSCGLSFEVLAGALKGDEIALSTKLWHATDNDRVVTRSLGYVIRRLKTLQTSARKLASSDYWGIMRLIGARLMRMFAGVF